MGILKGRGACYVSRVDIKLLISYTQYLPKAVKKYSKTHLKEFYFSCVINQLKSVYVFNIS